MEINLEYNRFMRTELIIGKEGIKKLKESHVAVFGIGGVGTFAVEALARSSVGEFTLIDYDSVDITNVNRQIIAVSDTIGLKKVELMKSRILSINPNAVVNILDYKYLPGDENNIFEKGFTYVVDAIDMISSKIDIICQCKKREIPIISSMGTGNKLDPTAFKVADIYETKVCPLAKVMRRELRKRGIDKLKVVYSEEEPIKITVDTDFIPEGKRSLPGSIAFVPSVAGLIIASVVVKEIVK
jgi:tRNA A37 threonylcarbamoyladenosine dehydratase